MSCRLGKIGVCHHVRYQLKVVTVAPTPEHSVNHLVEVVIVSVDIVNQLVDKELKMESGNK